MMMVLRLNTQMRIYDWFANVQQKDYPQIRFLLHCWNYSLRLLLLAYELTTASISFSLNLPYACVHVRTEPKFQVIMFFYRSLVDSFFHMFSLKRLFRGIIFFVTRNQIAHISDKNHIQCRIYLNLLWINWP